MTLQNIYINAYYIYIYIHVYIIITISLQLYFTIFRQLPISISNGLSNNSSSKQVFDMSNSEYEKALRESGYKNVKFLNKKKKLNLYR